MALSQKLESRHVSMIAIGGSIGTGLFLASGYSISVGGPGGALLAYLLMSVIVYFLMTSLGELSTYKPSSGSFCDYTTLYVGKSFGFAMGYNYWLNWAITIAAEISAASLVMGYWFPNINGVWFSIIFFLLIFISNIFSVRVYGEVEYSMSFVKVAIVIVFIVLGFFAIFNEPSFGLGRWTVGDAPFHKGWLGFITVFLFAGFSFQGTELVGVASGETKDPEVTIPKSIKMVFWRLTLFYILSIGVITLLINYSDPRLASQDSISMSPYTLLFGQFMGKYAGNIVNFIILTALISAANASMYSSTRILWYLGHSGQTLEIFKLVTDKKVPLPALLATSAVGATVFISSFIGNGMFFSYIIQISSLAGFLAWFGIALSHYKFRKNYLDKLGGENILKYKAKFYPFAQIFSMIVIAFVIIAQFITFGENYKLVDFIAVYSAIIIFLAVYLGHKIYSVFKK
ncbi:MAG TPA: lysine transporter [Lentisphaeria bacterium]|nr:MAG: lysine transporter [Lentisphaerae bacterium GWF2_38_69]HBM17049.1 lysine transporter [Lentisphaeria bacterium]